MLGAYYPGFYMLGQSGGLVVGVLTIQDARHTHSLENVTLIQQHLLNTADLAHSHTLETLALIEHKTLAIQDMLQGQALDSILLTQAHLLALSDLSHAQLLDALTLTQKHVLSLADALHSHTLDAIVVVADTALTIQDLQQGQTLDTVTIGVYQKPDGPPTFIKRNVPRADITNERGEIDIKKVLPRVGIFADAPKVAIGRVETIAPGVVDNDIHVAISKEQARANIGQERVDAIIPDSAPSFQFPAIDADASDVDADAAVDAGHSYGSRGKIPVVVGSPEPRGKIVTPAPRWLN